MNALGMLLVIGALGAHAPVSVSRSALLFGVSLGVEFTADGARLVFDHFDSSTGQWQLCTVPSDGSGPVVTIDVVGPGYDFKTSADGSRIVYLTPGCFQFVRSIAADGSGVPVTLGSFFNQCDGDAPFLVSPDGTRAAFKQDDYSYYTAPTDGSLAPLPLSRPEGDYVPVGEIGPLGTHFYYVVRVIEDVPPFGNYAPALCRTALAGSGDVELLSAFPAQWTFYGVSDFVLAPDESLVVYRSQVSSTDYTLQSVPADDSAPPTLLSTTLVTTPFLFLQLTGATNRVVYLATDALDGSTDLHSVPVDASAAQVRLSALPSTTRRVGSFALSPDGRWVVYLADEIADEVYQLHCVPVDGVGPRLVLNAPLAAGGDVSEFRISPDGARLVYLADQAQDGVSELFSVPMPSSCKARRADERLVKLSGPLPAGGDAFGSFAFTPDGARVVFQASAANGTTQVYSRATDGSTPRLALSEPHAPTGTDSFRVSSLGLVAFQADVSSHQELWVIPADGSGAAVHLNPGQP